ncbi:MAG: isocitrate/isopropylmalate dehydrogenase family protein [Euryarchaeota archaeon]|nr:isocitrate/isopropylmalate dehydrogenase family protein [Euryarchaeota archaeon]
MAKKTYKIALLGGDGVGPEVVAQGKRVLEAANERFSLNLDLQDLPMGAHLYAKTGKEWGEGVFDFCKKEADAILLGAVGWPGVSLPNGDIAGAGVIFGLRFGLDLYANVRPTKLYPGVPHKIHAGFQNVWDPAKVNFTIVRENTEGFYTPARGTLARGGVEEVATDTGIITRKGCERVIKYAFELAKKHPPAISDGKRRVTCIDKANVLRGSQFFRRVFDEVAAGYAGVEKDYAYVDAFTQWIIRNPENYQVCVAENMFGDIVTDLASVLQGGMGMAAGGNIGDRHAFFEPIHGSAPKYVGQDKVNPIATILAAQMMLTWVGERHDDKKLRQAADAIEKAVIETLAANVKTYDLGGTNKCSEVGAHVAGLVAAKKPRARLRA